MFIIMDDPHGAISGQNTLLKVIEEETRHDVLGFYLLMVFFLTSKTNVKSRTVLAKNIS